MGAHLLTTSRANAWTGSGAVRLRRSAIIHAFGKLLGTVWPYLKLAITTEDKQCNFCSRELRPWW